MEERVLQAGDLFINIFHNSALFGKMKIAL
jgi:hypothetical protein